MPRRHLFLAGRTMPQNAPVLTNHAPTGQAPVVPPEDSIWVRYSPHHEFPLSSVTSVALHILVCGLLVLGVIYAPQLGCLGSKEAPVDVGAIEIAEGPNDIPRPGGGGGAGGSAGAGAPEESVETGPEDKNLAPPADIPNLKVPQAENFDPIDIPKLTLPDGKHAVAEANQAIKSLQNVSSEARKKIWKGLGGGGSGSGSGGGKDTGKDKGVGPGEGEGGGKLTTQQKRVLRWRMTFDTRNGEDYVRQLNALGAILA